MFSSCNKLEYINLENVVVQPGNKTMNNITSITLLNLVIRTFDNLLIA